MKCEENVMLSEINIYRSIIGPRLLTCVQNNKTAGVWLILTQGPI